ncbi:hypothetical protein ACHAPK_011853, partial [Fusarium culmorum]
NNTAAGRDSGGGQPSRKPRRRSEHLPHTTISESTKTKDVAATGQVISSSIERFYRGELSKGPGLARLSRKRRKSESGEERENRKAENENEKAQSGMPHKCRTCQKGFRRLCDL